MRIGVAGCLLLAACSGSSPPSKVEGAPTRPPDDAYETPGLRVWHVLVWKCDERNERTSMVRRCVDADLLAPGSGCGGWQLERTLCPLDAAGRNATRTSGERVVEANNNARRPIPDGYGWR